MVDVSALDISWGKRVVSDSDLIRIFQTYNKSVYNYIYYRLGNVQLAEDLTGDVFEKVILKIHLYREDKAPFRVWLFAIARNCINDYLRQKQKHPETNLDSIVELKSLQHNPLESLEISESNAQLMQAVEGLNPREKNIIALKFGGELSNIQIGEVLGITETNVSSILYRTMKKLKQEMLKEGF